MATGDKLISQLDPASLIDGTEDSPMEQAARTLRVTLRMIADLAIKTEGQTVTGGGGVTSKDLGTISSGTLTPDPAARPLQHYTNGGAHTLAPSSTTGSILLDVKNSDSAGTITISGWTKTVGSFDTTNGHEFRCHLSIGQAGSLLTIQAMQ